MHPILHLGTWSIPTFGVCILAGTVCGFILLRFIRKFSDLSEENVLDGIIWAIILGFLGAKILYWITDPPAWPATWSELVTLLTRGLVFYGGLLGGIGALALVALRRKKNFFAFTDLLAPCFCLAHAGGRIGCVMAGCCYGRACTPSIFSLTYPNAAAFSDGIATRIATPLFEAIFLVLLAAALTVILIRQKRRARVTGWYLILYAIWRFGIEFLRGDEIRGFVGGLSTSQFISIFILLAGVGVLILTRNWMLPARDAVSEPLVFADDGKAGEEEAISAEQDAEPSADAKIHAEDDPKKLE